MKEEYEGLLTGAGKELSKNSAGNRHQYAERQMM
jgi:hypothetical protein